MAFVAITFFNLIALPADYKYKWAVFFAVEAYAVVLFILGKVAAANEAERIQAEREMEELEKDKLRERGKDATGVIVNVKQTGGRGTNFHVDYIYDLMLTVKAKTEKGEEFSCEVPAEAEYLEMPDFRPGKSVKIRFLPEDPSNCEFVETLKDVSFGTSAQAQNAPRPVVCKYCRTNFDWNENAKCPQCGAPYAN